MMQGESAGAWTLEAYGKGAKYPHGSVFAQVGHTFHLYGSAATTLCLIELLGYEDATWPSVPHKVR